MGINFVFVNARKRQFFDPDLLLDNSKSMGYLSGLHPRCITLLCCNNVAGFGRSVGGWAGTWCGDAVYLIGDGSSEPDLPEIGNGPELRAGRTLWSFIFDEYDDISYSLLASLCNADHDLCADLAARAKAEAGTALVHLGNVVHLDGCEPLREALRSACGGAWVAQYQREYLRSSSGREAAERRTRRCT